MPAVGGPVIPDVSKAGGSAFDFERLERAVAQLVGERERLQRENAVLRHELTEKRQRIRTLDGKILDANQRRRDVTKRVDDLIAQIDHLESRFADEES